jgi:hypothetical protein
VILPGELFEDMVRVSSDVWQHMLLQNDTSMHMVVFKMRKNMAIRKPMASHGKWPQKRCYLEHSWVIVKKKHRK